MIVPAPVGRRAHYRSGLVHVSHLDEAAAFVTLDGSTIRELAGAVSIAGECVVIPPGAVHKLINTGDVPIRLLCCCAPDYSDADTVLAGG